MSTTVSISAADVNKLRQMTGAGMMDCKKALAEANGDFEAAIDYLRKKGQKVAVNRSDKEANEGIVLAKTTADGKKGVMLCINCETDFVAKSADFTSFTNNILDLAVGQLPASGDALKALSFEGVTVNDKLFDLIGKIGEKIELSKYEMIVGARVVVYNHPGNKLASMVALNSDKPASINEIGKEVAMQIAAMNPVAIDKGDVDQKMLDRELEIGREQARSEGKPEQMIEKIAAGKLNKFYQENTLLNQHYIKDDKKTIAKFLDDCEKGLTVTAFRRIKLGA